MWWGLQLLCISLAQTEKPWELDTEGDKSRKLRCFKFVGTIEKTAVQLSEDGLKMVETDLVPSLASAVLGRLRVYVFLGNYFHA